MTARTPLAMAAASARDKIGELWTTSMRTVEDSLNKRNDGSGEFAADTGTPDPLASGTTPAGVSPEGNSMSLERLESVVRVMFGSCTTGATGVVPTGDDDLELDLRKSKSNHTTKSHQPPSKAALSSSSWSPANRTRSSNNVNEQDATTNNVAERSIPTANADHVYKQLFIDDQRSNKVFHQQPLSKRLSPSRNPTPIQQPVAPPPPPQPMIIATTKPTHHRATTHPSNFYNSDREILPTGSLSFDDGISAISAHTLEEMARMQEMQSQRKNILHQQQYGSPRPLPSIEYSTDSSLFPPSTPERLNTAPQNNDCDRLGPSMSPLTFGRQGRSHGSRHTSFGSQSTRTSGDFASAWRRDEKKYWEEEVENDKRPVNSNYNKGNKVRSSSAVILNGSVGCAKVNSRKASRRRSRSRDSVAKNNQDLTITTASSSIYSTWSNSGAGAGFDRFHPHDIYHLETSDVVATTSPLTTTSKPRPQGRSSTASRASESTTTTAMDHFTTKAGSGFKDYLVFPSVQNGDIGEI